MNDRERKKLESDDVQMLFDAILKCRTKEELMKFLRDLMTMREIETFSLRLQAVRMLDEGISYLEIERLTGLSSATIARGSEYLKYGNGGYRIVLDRLKKKR